MVKSCLVSTCKNTIGKPGITFHKIGKRRYTERLRAIGRNLEDCLSTQNVICSKHYAAEDFIHFNGKKYLRVEALPRFFVPRRFIMEKTTIAQETTTRSMTELQSSSNNTTNLNSSEDDALLRCTDLSILSSQDDTSDTLMSQVNLSQYPTDEFLSSLLSEGCDSLDFDNSVGPITS